MTAGAPTLCFPPSTRTRSRTLVVHNPTKEAVWFKVVSSQPSITLNTIAGQISPNESANVVVEVVPGRVTTKEHGFVAVFARSTKSFTGLNLESWATKAVAMRELAYRIPVRVRTDFAALETVVALPGEACLIESLTHPLPDVDDSDTRTAQDVEDDTRTGRNFLPCRDIDEVLPSTSLIDTCRNIAEDTLTSRNIHSDVATAHDLDDKGWLQKVLDYLFPPYDPLSGAPKEEVFPCGAGIIGRRS